MSITTDSILRSWREYLDRSPEWDRRNVLRWWRDHKPELWRMFAKAAGKHSELVREVDADDHRTNPHA